MPEAGCGCWSGQPDLARLPERERRRCKACREGARPHRQGPWYNAKGVKIADNVADLHSDRNNLKKETALDEKGNPVNARGDKPNKHDILTGSQPDGTAYPAGEDMTCRNWTAGNSGNLAGKAQIGHRDRQGNTPEGVSWNSAHGTRGCGQEDMKASGGAGLFYCFATK